MKRKALSVALAFLLILGLWPGVLPVTAAVDPVHIVVGHTDGVATREDVWAAAEAAGLGGFMLDCCCCCEEYGCDGCYFFGWSDTPFSVTFAPGVTHIGDLAFWGASTLTSLVIPDSVTHVGDQAFSRVRSLTSLTIGTASVSLPAAVVVGHTDGTVTQENANSAFSDVFNAYFTGNPISGHNVGFPFSVTFAPGVTHIGHSAFSWAESLTSLVIPDSVTHIGNQAFVLATSLTSVVIPDSVTHIGNSAFALATSLTSVVIGNSVTTIGRGAFSNARALTSVVIGNSVTHIGNQAFWGASALTSATFLGSAPASFGYGVFDIVCCCDGGGARPDFRIYFPAGATGWTTPTWNGYRAYPIGDTPSPSPSPSPSPQPSPQPSPRPPAASPTPTPRPDRPRITRQPRANHAVRRGRRLNLNVRVATIPRARRGTVAFRWQRSTNRRTWRNISGAAARRANFRVPTARRGTTFYRLRITNTLNRRTATRNSRIFRVRVR